MAVDTLPPRSPAPPPEPAAGRGRHGLLERLSGYRPTRLAIGGFLLALTLASLYLRTRQLNFYYWIDEAISVGISSHPLSQLPHLLREDGSPPLYYALLHVWIRLFGSGGVATHWLSLIFALITVPVAYWGGASLFGRRAGVYGAVLAAAVPFVTSYAQETRMYSLLVLLSLIVAVSFVHVFVERRRRYLPVFSLSLAIALYTHNWALFLVLATFAAYLFCVWATPARRRDLWRDGLIGFGVVGLLYLPWLPTLLYQAQHTGAPWALAPVIWSLPDAFYFIAGGRGATMTLALAAGFGLFASGIGGVVRRPRRVSLPAPGTDDRSPAVAAAALAILAFGTLLIAWLYAKTTPAWSGRYLAVIVGPTIVLVALGLTRARGLGVVALVFACCFWVLDPRPPSRDAKSNVASLAHVMSHRTGPTTLVLSTQPEQVPTLVHYLPNIKRFGTPLGLVPDPRVVDWRNGLQKFEHSRVRTVLAPMIRSLIPGQRVLLVIPTQFAKAPTWMNLIRRDSKTWLRYVEHDRRLRLIETASPYQYSTSLAVRGYLYVVRTG
ncbi:MAG TPA: glycosyltransferase family 39 protein [Solirubrobacteraceae bacterium]|nr:glycosyltransferase family 39 protein [Solirubrobacteraceae bacterium]